MHWCVVYAASRSRWFMWAQPGSLLSRFYTRLKRSDSGSFNVETILHHIYLSLLKSATQASLGCCWLVNEVQCQEHSIFSHFQFIKTPGPTDLTFSLCVKAGFPSKKVSVPSRQTSSNNLAYSYTISEFSCEFILAYDFWGRSAVGWISAQRTAVNSPEALF